jgi:transcriptional regulator with XRE-family HTH domain
LKGARNIIGPQLRRIRSQSGLSQPAFAARCQRMGWDLSRDTLAKIESQVRWVADFELIFLAQALGVPLLSLLPDNRRVKTMAREFVLRMEIGIS